MHRCILRGCRSTQHLGFHTVNVPFLFFCLRSESGLPAYQHLSVSTSVRSGRCVRGGHGAGEAGGPGRHSAGGLRAGGASGRHAALRPGHGAGEGADGHAVHLGPGPRPAVLLLRPEGRGPLEHAGRCPLGHQQASARPDGGRHR